MLIFADCKQSGQKFNVDRFYFRESNRDITTLYVRLPHFSRLLYINIMIVYQTAKMSN